MLAVVLPDGSPGTIVASATDVLGEEEGQAEAGLATVLSLEGVRQLRLLVEAKSRGWESRGTGRRAT